MMKTLTSTLMSILVRKGGQRSVQVLGRFLFVLILMIACYTWMFHVLMAREGQVYSWLTGLYWTLTVMSTLGFGDITFHGDLGRMFSLLVLLSGMLFMLTLLPFTFIQFFYAPWMAAQSTSRARRHLPADRTGHVILVHDDEVTRSLMRKLDQFHYPYVMITPDVARAVELGDEGVEAVVGEWDDPDTYARVRIGKAALLAVTSSDIVNANVVSTARALQATLPIIATAKEEHSIDILSLAGANRVLRLGEMMGSALARRIVAGDAMTHVIGSFGDLIFAEATVSNTPLVGKTLRESGLREHVQVNVIGFWHRGTFRPADPETVIEEHTILVLAGSRSQLEEYDELFCIYNMTAAPVVIIGGGRVGRATGRALEKRGVDYRIVELLAERIREDERYVHGNAADLDILRRAGIVDAPAVVITSHDDDLNVYLTIYCRKLRPDAQIITRASTERNIDTLHRAGADFVLSYASMGANAVFNLLKRSDVLMLAEGLDLFKMAMPRSLAGRTLAAAAVRRLTGCTVVAIRRGEELEINPDPNQPLPLDGELIVIGSDEAEAEFLEQYADG
jgi:Trk K+ transport system NAD-binding subunit